jgi:GNAT superfamily N-acetyltransferase
VAELTIRTATVADEAAALDLMQELFESPGVKPDDYSRARASEGFQRYVEEESGDVLLAEAGGALVGLASVYVDIQSIRFGTRCWLEDLIVTSAQRSTGVGGRLLEAATDWARERGCTHLELDSGNARKDAHRFYVDQGMEQQGLIFHLPIAPSE